VSQDITQDGDAPSRIAHLTNKKNETALICAELSNGGSVLVFLDITNPQTPIPMELRITGNPWTGSEDDLKPLLNKWKPSEPKPISSATLRSINLGGLVRAYVQIEERKKAAADHLGFQPEIMFTPGDFPENPDAQVFGFRNSSEYKAAMQRLGVAVAYVEATSQGDPKPAVTIANELFDGDKDKARSVIAQARKHGYLSTGTAGRVGGELTEKSLTFLAHIKAQYERTQRGKK